MRNQFLTFFAFLFLCQSASLFSYSLDSSPLFIRANNVVAADYTEEALEEKIGEKKALLIQEEQQHNNEITNAIMASMSEEKLVLLSLYIERAISYFLLGELDCAIEDFEYVLSSLDLEAPKERDLLGIALWGRLLCHAFSNSLEETQDDIQLIRYFFIDSHDCNCIKNKSHTSRPIRNSEQPSAYIFTKDKYKSSQERISSHECMDRVKGTANAAKGIALKITNYKIRALVNEIISQLEDFGYSCCRDAPEWTKCLDPIVNAWKKLQTSWDKLKEIADKGVQLAPYLAGPC
jgi:hypothetical protein